MTSSKREHRILELDGDYFRTTLPAALATLAESLPTMVTDVNLTTFRSQWRRALYNLAEDPSTEPDKHITTPSGQKFELLMIPETNSCPCCVDVDSEDENYHPPPAVESDTGVTRGQFIRTIADVLYGKDGEDEMPADWVKKLYVLNDLEPGRVWPHKVDWMMYPGGGLMGQRIFVVCKGTAKLEASKKQNEDEEKA